MMKWLAAGIAATLLVASHAALPQEAANPFARRLLAVHNQARDAAGVPRLAWSNELAREALAWAKVLAGKGRMEHASETVRRGKGENLWMGSAGYYSAETMVGAFVAEGAQFRSGAFPDISRTGRWQDVGHYSQVIWPGTTAVGCAVARGAKDDFLVCRYDPPGNIWGQPVGRK